MSFLDLSMIHPWQISSPIWWPRQGDDARVLGKCLSIHGCLQLESVLNESQISSCLQAFLWPLVRIPYSSPINQAVFLASSIGFMTLQGPPRIVLLRARQVDPVREVGLKWDVASTSLGNMFLCLCLVIVPNSFIYRCHVRSIWVRIWAHENEHMCLLHAWSALQGFGS